VSSSPLLVCDRARIEVLGVPLAPELSLETHAAHAALLGASAPVFRLLSGQAQLGAGSVRVAGLGPRQALEQGALGIALGNTELPPRWRGLEYLEQSARLCGQRPRAAASAARSLLEAWGLGALASRLCRELLPAEQRVLVLAQAVLGSPAVLAAAHLFAGLEPSGQRYVADRLARASAGRGLLLGIDAFVPDVVEREVVATAGEVLLVQNGTVLAQGTPADVLAPGPRYRVSVLSAAARLAECLQQRGLHVGPQADRRDDMPAELLVELPEGTSAEVVLEESLRAGAVVLELSPLALAAGGLGP
jgi:ABC-type multidrug transport system ATPase subunit